MHHLSVKVMPYAEEIIRDNQCEFRRNGSTSNQIFCVSQMLEKQWKYYRYTNEKDEQNSCD